MSLHKSYHFFARIWSTALSIQLCWIFFSCTIISHLLFNLEALTKTATLQVFGEKLDWCHLRHWSSRRVPGCFPQFSAEAPAPPLTASDPFRWPNDVWPSSTGCFFDVPRGFFHDFKMLLLWNQQGKKNHPNMLQSHDVTLLDSLVSHHGGCTLVSHIKNTLAYPACSVHHLQFAHKNPITISIFWTFFHQQLWGATARPSRAKLSAALPAAACGAATASPGVPRAAARPSGRSVARNGWNHDFELEHQRPNKWIKKIDVVQNMDLRVY